MKEAKDENSKLQIYKEYLAMEHAKNMEEKMKDRKP